MPAWRSLDRKGFTLVEVLVALAIVSVALIAALRTAGQGTNSLNEQRVRLLGGWVAENLLASHRARGDWLPVGSQEGLDRQGGIDFQWREEVLATPNQSFRRVNVEVFAAPDNTHVVARLTGFIVLPVKNN